MHVSTFVTLSDVQKVPFWAKKCIFKSQKSGFFALFPNLYLCFYSGKPFSHVRDVSYVQDVFQKTLFMHRGPPYGFFQFLDACRKIGEIPLGEVAQKWFLHFFDPFSDTHAVFTVFMRMRPFKYRLDVYIYMDLYQPLSRCDWTGDIRHAPADPLPPLTSGIGALRANLSIRCAVPAGYGYVSGSLCCYNMVQCVCIYAGIVRVYVSACGASRDACPDGSFEGILGELRTC